MDIVTKILRTTVVLGSISVNPHFDHNPLQQRQRTATYQTEPDAAMQRPKVIADDSYALAVMLSFYCMQTQTHVKLTIWIFTWFFLIFARLPPVTSAARCGAHPPHPPRYATAYCCTCLRSNVFYTSNVLYHHDSLYAILTYKFASHQ